jgi:hypothetical protein
MVEEARLERRTPASRQRASAFRKEQPRRTLGVGLLGSARLEGKRELKLVKHVAVFFLPGAGGRLQRVEELLLLLAIELEILTRRGKGAPASLDLDPIREVRSRLGDDGPALELRHQEGRSSLGHAPISTGEEEADRRHPPSISRSHSRFPVQVRIHLKSNFRSAGRLSVGGAPQLHDSVSSRAVGGLLRVDPWRESRTTASDA